MAVWDATEQDLPALLALGAAFHPQHPLGQVAPYDPDSAQRFFTGLMTSPTGLLLVGDHAGQPAGFVAGVVVPIYFNTAWLAACEILWYVMPEARGHGLGGHLAAAFATWAQGHGAVVLQCGAPVGSPETAALLVRQGFMAYESLYMRRL